MRNANLILTAPLPLTLRRNHGLEHATLHVLGERIRAIAQREADPPDEPEPAEEPPAEEQPKARGRRRKAA